MDKKFYRYELVVKDSYYSNTPTIELRLRTFVVHKETTMGYWIVPDGDRLYTFIKPRWIKKGKTNKKFARETKKRALECYIIRTNKRIGYLQCQLQNAEHGLGKAIKLNEEQANG